MKPKPDPLKAISDQLYMQLELPPRHEQWDKRLITKALKKAQQTGKTKWMAKAQQWREEAKSLILKDSLLAAQQTKGKK